MKKLKTTVAVDEKKFTLAIQNIYKSVNILRKAFPDRNFTLDGKLLGDIGEAIGKILYNLTLYPKSNHAHWDGYWIDELNNVKMVQIRATQCDTTYFKKPSGKGTFLMFKINREKMGEYSLVYNGDIMTIWNKVKHQKNKEKSITLSKLMNLQKKNDKFSIPKRK